MTDAGLKVDLQGALLILTIDREDRRNALDRATWAGRAAGLDRGGRDPGN